MDKVDALSPSCSFDSPSVPAPAPIQVKHQYGTRIRSNSVIKPSARLRQSPDLPSTLQKKSKHASNNNTMSKLNMPCLSVEQISTKDMPIFPPSPDIMLHPDDANSKVLLAIGRSFLSVDNRAMTIKDLAEMTLKFGLLCQNVSAAGQAITTYIRNHMQRCDAQQDHPLLLRHILSGTPADDDLIPALHSRSGGAHCTGSTSVPEHRCTNFRRGTMVWYLSKATGAPCPFQRAGIRLCDYGENGKYGNASMDERERRRERDRLRRMGQCGQKRKRLLRTCADGSTSDEESDVEGRKAPKVKLTLRLGATGTDIDESLSVQRDIIDLSRDSDSDSDEDDSMSVDGSEDSTELCATQFAQTEQAPWALPPYPRRSISIPCYTPSLEAVQPVFTFNFQAPESPCQPYGTNPYRRSPSVPLSVASPPPDSEDEDDDYHISMTNSSIQTLSSTARPTSHDSPDDWDFDWESNGEGDTETQWESPGPRSPSAPFAHRSLEVKVEGEQENADVYHILCAIEDSDGLATGSDGDSTSKVMKILAGMTMGSTEVKVEEPSFDWDAINRDDLSSSPWSPWAGFHAQLEPIQVKKEEDESDGVGSLYPHDAPSPVTNDSDLFSLSPLTPLSMSPLSPLGSSLPAPSTSLRRHSEFPWNDAELLGPDSIRLQELDDGEWTKGCMRPKVLGTRARANTSPDLSSNLSVPVSASKVSLGQSGDKGDFQRLVEIVAEATRALQDASEPVKDGRSIVEMDYSAEAASSAHVPTSSASLSLGRKSPDNAVVVHACQPCTPAITATQVEGIPVYQTTLDSLLLMRRIDTDFVHLTPVITHLGLPFPPPASLPNATTISKGSASVYGTWVPLAVAQMFVREHPLSRGDLNVFLSDSLFELFPPALQDFHRSNAPGRLLNQFGPHFKSTLNAKRRVGLNQGVSYNDVLSWDNGPASDIDYEDHMLALHPPFALSLPNVRPTQEHVAVVETPLSPMEQEMFQTLCVIPDWDNKEGVAQKDNTSQKECATPVAVAVSKEAPAKVADVPVPEVDVPATKESSPVHVQDRPLRRSKRVADALAARSRTRSRKRGSRNSLS